MIMRPQLSIRFPAIVGAVALILLLFGLGLWSATTRIAGAVVAHGRVEVEHNRQIVQHPDGGVVGEILARDGDVVTAGQTLLRLDDTFVRTELAIIERTIVGIIARRGRLTAERNRATFVAQLDAPALTTVSAAQIEAQIEEERAFFAARETSLADEIRALEEQARQTDLSAEGAAARITALDRQLDLIRNEAGDLDNLLRNGLVPVSRLNALHREEARIMGEIGQLSSDIAEARARVSQVEVEILRRIGARQEQAIAELRDLEFTEIELLERRNGLLALLEGLDLRAPVSGTVFGSTVFAQHAVIRPADPVLYIVPSDQPFQVTARVDPRDIDQVVVGQPATLVFSSFNRRATPEIAGRIIRVSADAREDATTGAPFYQAIVAPDDAAMAALGTDALRPGMPVEVFITTEARTPLAYMLQPATDHFRRALRED